MILVELNLGESNKDLLKVTNFLYFKTELIIVKLLLDFNKFKS